MLQEERGIKEELRKGGIEKDLDRGGGREGGRGEGERGKGQEITTNHV